MHRPVYVYAYDANLDIDSCLYRISPDDAAIRLARGYVSYLSPNSVQLKPPPDFSPDHTNSIPAGTFQSAWAPRLSAHYLVWQLLPHDDSAL
jgi:hypothetical protein